MTMSGNAVRVAMLGSRHSALRVGAPFEIETLIRVQTLFVVLRHERREGHGIPPLTLTVSVDNNCGDADKKCTSACARMRFDSQRTNIMR
jgi:hypothetical protein